MSLTISGGEWGGRRLKVPDRQSLRPSAGRVKAAIFSILESIQWKRAGAPDFSGWHCLDLFAGVGGLGLEILSRGAQDCVFVEKDRKHAAALRENITSLNADSRCVTLVEPVERWGWERYSPFDLILMDPPYAAPEVEMIFTRIAEGNVLKPGGILLLEHDPSRHFEATANLSLHSTRKLGPAGISVFLRT